MNGHRREDEYRVLAIDPTSRGFGYAVLEGPAFLVDWGTRDLGRADSARALPYGAALIDHYAPDAVVVEDTTAAATRRCDRVQRLIEAIGETAAARGVAVERVSRPRVADVFANGEAPTKHRTATVIAEHFPELVPRLPPKRKPWMSEDTRMAIFDAVAFALTHYYLNNESQPAKADHSRH